MENKNQRINIFFFMIFALQPCDCPLRKMNVTISTILHSSAVKYTVLILDRFTLGFSFKKTKYIQYTIYTYI